MSIAVLNQVYDEVRRLSVAGSNLAAGDFRLKKLVDPLRKSAAKAPVFGKVADTIEKVLESNQQNSAEALLELTTLTTAILYTQGETGAEGKLEPIKSQELGLTVSNTSARMLKPLIEALTTIGSGRLEIIKDAHERGAFSDLRLIKHAIAAIDDKYGEIGDYVAEKILPMYGKAIYAEIQEGYDPHGHGDDVRRLKLLHQLDPKATKPLVDAALEDSSKDVKLEAINCLQGRADAVQFLLEQAKAKNSEVRSSALRSLAPIDDPQAIALLKEVLSGPEVDRVARIVPANPSKELQSFIVEEAIRQRDALLTPPPKAKQAAPKAPPAKNAAKATKVPEEKEQGSRFHELLQAFQGRTDKPAVAFLLDCLEKQDEMLKIKAGRVDGEDINRRIVQMLLLSGSKETMAKLAERGADTTADLVEYGFLASSLVDGKVKAYEKFHAAYLNRPSGKSNAAAEARAVAERIGRVLDSVGYCQKHGRHWSYYREGTVQSLYPKVDLDSRWLNAALEIADMEVILELARDPHPGVWEYLGDWVDAELKKKTWDPTYRLDEVFRAMIRTKHPDLLPKFLAVVERSNAAKANWWSCYYVVRLIGQLPQEAIAPLEALVPKIQEQLLDAYVGSLDELKQKHKTAK